MSTVRTAVKRGLLIVTVRWQGGPALRVSARTLASDGNWPGADRCNLHAQILFGHAAIGRKRPVAAGQVV